jgi:hypothetical protein
MYIKTSDLILTDVFGVTSTTTYSHLGLQILPHTFVLADESNKIRSKPDTASLLLASVCGGMSGCVCVCVCVCVWGGGVISNEALNRTAL